MRVEWSKGVVEWVWGVRDGMEGMGWKRWGQMDVKGKHVGWML